MQKWTLKHGGRTYGPMPWAEMRVVIKVVFGGGMCAHISECPHAEPACCWAQYCPRVPDYEHSFVGRISREEAVSDGRTEDDE